MSKRKLLDDNESEPPVKIMPDQKKLEQTNNLFNKLIKKPMIEKDDLRCCIDPYVFSCPYLLVGLSRSGKSTFLAKYMWEWIKYNLNESKMTIIMLLTLAEGTKDIFKKLKKMTTEKTNNPLAIKLFIFTNFSKYIKFYNKLKLLTTQSDWNGRIYCIVDDMPEAISGDVDGIKKKIAETFWNELVSRGSHSATQLIFSIQTYSQLNSWKIKSQIKITVFFNLPNNVHFKKMTTELGSFAGCEITYNQMKTLVSEPVDASIEKKRDYKIFIYGITNNNSIINFNYRVSIDFINEINK